MLVLRRVDDDDDDDDRLLRLRPMLPREVDADGGLDFCCPYNVLMDCSLTG